MAKDVGLYALGFGALAAAAYFAYRAYDASNPVITRQARIEALMNSPYTSTATVNRLGDMTDQELTDVYNFIMEYVARGKAISETDPLFDRLYAINVKYQLAY